MSRRTGRDGAAAHTAAARPGPAAAGARPRVAAPRACGAQAAAEAKASPRPRVGVLALQGDFERHTTALESLGVEVVRVALPRDLERLDAIVLPGGESTTMLRLMTANGLSEPLAAFVRERPALGTCAGVILLGAGADGLPAETLGALDVSVERNAYGRQIDSFSETLECPAVGGTFPGVFIRAPRIRRVAGSVEVIARRSGGNGAGEPVGVRSGRIVGLCFHPELTSDLRLHRWFLTAVAGLALPAVPADPGARADVAAAPRAGATAGRRREAAA